MRTIVTLTGPSCAGKTTLIRRLVEKYGFMEIISTTTRPMRAGEVNGEHYYFVSDEEFDKLDFVEKVEFGGNRYGATVNEVERCLNTGKTPAIVVEPWGMTQFTRFAAPRGYRHLSVFLNADKRVLLNRFLNRFASDTKANTDVYTTRLLNLIETEMLWYTTHEYDLHIGNYDEATMTECEKKILFTLTAIDLAEKVEDISRRKKGNELGDQRIIGN